AFRSKQVLQPPSDHTARSCDENSQCCVPLLSAKIVKNETAHQCQLAFGQLVAKGGHAVSAVCDLIIYLGFRLHFEFALAQARHLSSVVQYSPVRFRAVTDRTVLPEKRSFIRLTVGNDISFWT